ncbi:MAG: TIGR04086 family membrane protein [Candidatus Melainabacteria bacterium]|nr:TIGR04086 family membrane protein [Candidatus Melainabacteria bacterium]
MIFSTEFWPFALLWATMAAAVGALLAFQAGDRVKNDYRKTITYSAKRSAIWSGGLTFVVSLLLVRFLMYYVQPSFQGTWFGYFPVILTAMTPAFILGMLFGGHAGKRGWVATIAAAVVFFGVAGVHKAYSTWGPGNAQRYAALASIRTATSEETIPPTDPNKMVQVDKNVAAFKGQTALTSTSQNLGSRFKIDPESYVLQAVQGHRYWIAPLIFANSADNFWGPLFGNYAVSPGYVVVDAQNPDAEAKVRLNFNMTLLKDGAFAQDVLRHLYQHGYNDGKFVEVKFEVDDEWRPHYIVSYARNKFEGVGGLVIEKIIVVDISQSAPKVSEYELGKEPEWVERAMPLTLIKSYVDDWGFYNNQYARDNGWMVWLGLRKDESIKAAEFDQNYTTDNHSVWVIPMTSVNGTDHAVTGIVVYETTKNEAVFFPGVRGFNTGETVKETIAHAPVFLGKNLSVDQVQLYSIYGELTWVAVITNPQGSMKGFAGIALLHAHGQNASEVVFAPNMGVALGQYRSQLARLRAGHGQVSRVSETKELTGTIVGFGTIPGNMQQPNTWVIQVEGDARIFAVTRDSYAKIPMVREGDKIAITYLEVGGNELAVSAVKVERLDGPLTAAKPAGK